MAAANIEQFNVLVGAIFAKLYEGFPIPTDLVLMDFLEQMTTDQTSVEENPYHNVRFFSSTVLWLADHGYLDSGSVLSNGTVIRCTLTARALELLKAMPSNLENKDPSLGDQLVSATKDGMTGKVKELASDLLTKAVVFGTKAATDWVGS